LEPTPKIIGMMTGTTTEIARNTGTMSTQTKIKIAKNTGMTDLIIEHPKMNGVIKMRKITIIEIGQETMTIMNIVQDIQGK
jgi:hypothetical protein